MWKNTYFSYGSITKIFHWLVFLLVFFMLIYGFCLSYIAKEYQAVAYNIHKLTGLTILIIMLLRLCWTLVNPKPLLPVNTPHWQVFLDRLVQWLFYIVLIAMPLAGLIGSSAAGKAPHIGQLVFSLPIAQNEAIVTLAFGIHNTLAFVLIGLLTIHIFAAFYHYFVRKDDVLQRMLPSRSSRLY